MSSVTDYALARRAVLRDFRRGTLTRLDVCDAHPELIRAAQFIGTDVDDECPVCGSPVRPKPWKPGATPTRPGLQ